jgi:hypothetical protein
LDLRLGDFLLGDLDLRLGDFLLGDLDLRLVLLRLGDCFFFEEAFLERRLGDVV